VPQDAERDQRREPLPVRRRLEHARAVKVHADRRDELRLVRREIVERQRGVRLARRLGHARAELAAVQRRAARLGDRGQ
jgi:hypothetical protein